MTVFVVEGDGMFPFDMLRHDRCWPASSSDAQAIASLSQERRRVSLEFTQMNLFDQRPSAARWSSFGWTVMEHSVVQPAKHAARRQLDHRGRR